jgi:hypothetical protein
MRLTSCASAKRLTVGRRISRAIAGQESYGHADPVYKQECSSSKNVVEMNAGSIPLSCVRFSFLPRGFLYRAAVVAIFVTLTHQFQWAELRYLTSEAVLRLSGLAGLSVERVTADTIRVQGNLFRYVISCTFVDVVIGAIPLIWSFTKSIAKNLLILVSLSISFVAVNLVRLELSQLLYARGVSWIFADDILGGVAYFAVWIFIVSHFRNDW